MAYSEDRNLVFISIYGVPWPLWVRSIDGPSIAAPIKVISFGPRSRLTPPDDWIGWRRYFPAHAPAAT